MRRLMKIAVCQLLMTTCTLSAYAQTVEGTVAEPDPVLKNLTRVEESWVALIENPDELAGAPQIVNLISPDGSSDANFGLFEINHGSAPDFVSGGLQIQAWKNETLMQKTNSISGRVLTRKFDRFEYTVSMALVDGKLEYRLVSGKSKTWGNFAKDKNLSASTDSSVTLLDKYDRQYSVDNTLVNVAAHRIEALYQKEVKYTPLMDWSRLTKKFA